jgi:hypothetical protein
MHFLLQEKLCSQAGWTAEDQAILTAMAAEASTAPSPTLAGPTPQHLRSQGSAASSPPVGADTGLTLRKTPWLLVVNKTDLTPANRDFEVPDRLRGLFSAAVTTSAATGQGLTELKAAVLELAGAPRLARGAQLQRPVRAPSAQSAFGSLQQVASRPSITAQCSA